MSEHATARPRMPGYLIGCLIGVTIILLPVGACVAAGLIIASGAPGCMETAPGVEMISPTGQYVARSVGEICWIYEPLTIVTLRLAADGDIRAGEAVFYYDGTPTDLRLRWLGEQVLEIQHSCGIRHRSPRMWQDVAILYKLVEPSTGAYCENESGADRRLRTSGSPGATPEALAHRDCVDNATC